MKKGQKKGLRAIPAASKKDRKKGFCKPDFTLKRQKHRQGDTTPAIYKERAKVVGRKSKGKKSRKQWKKLWRAVRQPIIWLLGVVIAAIISAWIGTFFQSSNANTTTPSTEKPAIILVQKSASSPSLFSSNEGRKLSLTCELTSSRCVL